jgi:hypothetical protein
MDELDHWMTHHGRDVAQALERQRDPICHAVSAELRVRFPLLCLEASRPDGAAFQELAFTETPRRFHRLIQAALLFRSRAVIVREYAWGMGVLYGYGVTPHHMLTQVRLYQMIARERVSFAPGSTHLFDHLIDHVALVIDQLSRDGTPGEELVGTTRSTRTSPQRSSS